MVATQEHGGSVTNPASGRPDAAAHSARRAGSNSFQADGYGDCRHCPRSFTLSSDGRIPHHAVPTDGPERRLAPVCHGSGELLISYMGA